MQLTTAEIQTMREMVTVLAHRHMSIRALALYAQRVGRLFAAPATWSKLIRERGWRRPRQSGHPMNPKQGLRATKPNEYWHIDVMCVPDA